jgi:multiple sugar transport system ATP-binding protein
MNLIGNEAAGRYSAATIGIRPEHIIVGHDGEGWTGTVRAAEHLGSDTFIYVDVPGTGSITARYIGELGINEGDSVRLGPDPAHVHRFDKDGKAVR